MFPRQKGRKGFFVLRHFVVFLLLLFRKPVQNAGRGGSLIILIVSEALVRIGQSGLE